MKIFKQVVRVVGFIGLMAVLQGCAYGMMSTVGKEHVVILRNDIFLFGALRQASVCKVTPSGLTGCKQGETP